MAEKVTTLTKEEKEMFDYLNDLRNSGVCNMFGASPYLKEEFDISTTQARQVVALWMENFNEHGYDHLV